MALLSIVLLVWITGFDHIFASASPSNDNLILECLSDLSTKIREFQQDPTRQIRRPFVTLAYAQTIDGKIAQTLSSGSTSSNFAISGPESLKLTHALRSIHDAILVGGKTLSVDNPRLTNRLWVRPWVRPKPCVPVVLDTHLRHVRSLGISMRAQNPIVCCSKQAYYLARKEGYFGPDEEGNGPQICYPPVTLLPCHTRILQQKDGDTKEILDLRDVLSRLHQKHGIQSLMVEGGASVLSLFAEGDSYDNESSLFDCLCVTISPKLLGSSGLDSLSSFGGNVGISKHIALGPLKCISLGEDCVLFADRKRHNSMDDIHRE